MESVIFMVIGSVNLVCVDRHLKEKEARYGFAAAEVLPLVDDPVGDPLQIGIHDWSYICNSCFSHKKLELIRNHKIRPN